MSPRRAAGPGFPWWSPVLPGELPWPAGMSLGAIGPIRFWASGPMGQ